MLWMSGKSTVFIPGLTWSQSHLITEISSFDTNSCSHAKSISQRSVMIQKGKFCWDFFAWSPQLGLKSAFPRTVLCGDKKSPSFPQPSLKGFFKKKSQKRHIQYFLINDQHLLIKPTINNSTVHLASQRWQCLIKWELMVVSHQNTWRKKMVILLNKSRTQNPDFQVHNLSINIERCKKDQNQRETFLNVS